MSNIELTIPADLTAAQFRRANPSIDEETAQKLAAELHDILAWVQKAFALQPSNLSIEESDALQTIWRTAVGFWPADKDAGANESIWAMEQLTRAERLTGENNLNERYLRVCGMVEGVDYASLLPSSESEGCESPLSRRHRKKMIDDVTAGWLRDNSPIEAAGDDAALSVIDEEIAKGAFTPREPVKRTGFAARFPDNASGVYPHELFALFSSWAARSTARPRPCRAGPKSRPVTVHV